MLQHTWTYKPLVHDVLGLALNRVTVEEPASAPAAAAVGLAPQAPAKKHFEARATPPRPRLVSCARRACRRAERLQVSRLAVASQGAGARAAVRPRACVCRTGGWAGCRLGYG